MLESKQKVKDICDRLMGVNPGQIIIDLVQDDVEEVLNADGVTPDDIGSLTYHCDILIEVYNPFFEEDLAYLKELHHALRMWGGDAAFANKALGIDPNK